MLVKAELINENRRTSALSPELTPLHIDTAQMHGEFVGSNGEIYDTTLDSCTCVDFSVNLGGAAPCKHMIRLGMELGVISGEGMESDLREAWAKFYAGSLITYAKSAELTQAMNMVATINTILSAGKKGILMDDDALEPTGIASIRECGLFEMVGKANKICCAKKWKKKLEAAVDALSTRIGKLAIDHLDDADLQTVLLFKKNAVPCNCIDVHQTGAASEITQTMEPVLIEVRDRVIYNSIMRYIREHTIEYVDKTANGGGLYFFDQSIAEELKAKGYTVYYADQGTKGTGHRAAWYMKFDMKE